MNSELFQFFLNKLKKFLLEELKTNKRSEIQKKHSDLKDAARHLPFKYKKMLADKEKEISSLKSAENEFKALVEQKETLLSEKESQINSHKAEISNHLATIDQKQNENNEFQKQLTEKETNNSSLQTSLSQREKTTEALDSYAMIIHSKLTTESLTVEECKAAMLLEEEKVKTQKIY